MTKNPIQNCHPTETAPRCRFRIKPRVINVRVVQNKNTSAQIPIGHVQDVAWKRRPGFAVLNGVKIAYDRRVGGGNRSGGFQGLDQGIIFGGGHGCLGTRDESEVQPGKNSQDDEDLNDRFHLFDRNFLPYQPTGLSPFFLAMMFIESAVKSKIIRDMIKTRRLRLRPQKMITRFVDRGI